jgi:hypothetical protein
MPVRPPEIRGRLRKDTAMKWSCVIPAAVALVSCLTGPFCQADEGLFDADPKHPWNRLHEQLHTRRTLDGELYRTLSLEPLVVRQSKFLIQGESHRNAMQVLGDFLEHDAGKLITDPRKRAILQRDLWAVFVAVSDSKIAYDPRRRALQQRLAQVIRRVALTEKELQSLPDNLALAVAGQKFQAKWDPEKPPGPVLPNDLWKPDGPWVSVRNRLRPDNLVAPLHFEATLGRSAFFLLLNLPGGRQATLAYLKTLETLPPNTEVPQIPNGTQVALLRQMLLIDETATLRITPVVESLQIRSYRSPREQDMVEFTLHRKEFLAGLAEGLELTAEDETNRFDLGFLGFELHRRPDPFDRRFKTRRSPVIMKTCMDCHAGPGIFGFQSVFAGHFDRPPFGKGDPEDQITSTIDQARETYTWGLLQGLWETQR